MGCLQSSNSSETPSGGLNVANIGAYRPGVFGSPSGQTLEAKVVLLGDSGVGKSSIALRFCQGRFSPFHEVTIGAAFLQQTVRLQNGNQLKLHIWDTGGQERFRAMASLYYRDAAGAAIVYDSSHAPSFESVKYWVAELRQKGPPGCRLSVAANKCDIADRQVDPQEARRFCESEGMNFVETSAKTGDGVGILFEQLAQDIYKQQQQPSSDKQQRIV